MILSSLKLKWILIIGLLLASLVMPVMGVEVTGTFTTGNNPTICEYNANGGSLGSYSFQTIYTPDIAALRGLRYYGGRDLSPLGGNPVFSCALNGTKCMDAGGHTTPIILKVGAATVGSGIVGINYNQVANTYKYYITLDSFDPGSLGGVQTINGTYDDAVLGGPRVYQYGGSTAPCTNYLNIQTAGSAVDGTWTYIADAIFTNNYAVNISESLSTVTYNRTISGQAYSSTVNIYGGTSLQCSAASGTTNFVCNNILGIPVTINATSVYGIDYSKVIYPTSAFSITLDPDTITTTQSTVGRIISTEDPFLSTITDISWKWNDATGYHNFYDGGNTSRPMEYSLKSGTWYGYDSTLNTYSVSKGASIPNPVTLSGITSTGDKTIYCYIFTSDGNFYTLTAPLTVGGTGGTAYTTTYAAAVDYSTGAFVSDATIGFRNVATGVWYSNVTVGGQNSINSPPGIYLDIQATAPGYAPVTRYSVTASQINQSPMYYELGMFPVSAITGANQTTFYVSVYDQNSGWALANAYVSVINASFQWAHYTGTNGIATFTVYNNTLYQVTATKAGYTPLTKFVTVLSGTVATTEMRLSPISTVIPTRPPDTTIPTPTTPIPGWTPATGGGGNFTGFWSPFQNALVASGCAPAAAGGILALFISMICLIIGFQAGGLPGGEMGAILGVGYSVAAGFFPLAIAIIVVVGLIAYVSLRFWGMTH